MHAMRSGILASSFRFDGCNSAGSEVAVAVQGIPEKYENSLREATTVSLSQLSAFYQV